MGGWQTTKSGKRNGGSNAPAMRGGSPYVKWMPNIVNNRALIRALRDMLGTDVKEPNSSMSEMIPEAHNAPSKANSIKTRDGHYVRSRGEALIDNFLYAARIAHAYEQELYLGEDAKVMIPDFTALTPKGNVYIEFWGMEGKSAYEERKEIKKKLYAEHELELVDVYPKHLDYIDSYLGQIFARYGVKTAF
jgi:predicted nuclease of restriction endonuclease-like RecB superfamily